MDHDNKTDAHATAAAALRERGLRPTRTRCLILSLLQKSRDHPTVAQIAARLSAAGEAVRLPTTYQCLDRMVQIHLLSSFVDNEGLLRFDVNPKPHHHLRCTGCGVIVDTLIPKEIIDMLKVPSLTAAEGAPAEAWTITEAKVQLQGICPSCRYAERHSG